MLRDLFSLFPACAGVIPDETNEHVDNVSFPRMCGGDPTNYKAVLLKALFSPHVRG